MPVLAAVALSLLAASPPREARVLYVDDDAPDACACRHPARNDDPGCGTSDRPYACIRDAVASRQTFDTLRVRDGAYPECVTLSRSGASDTERMTVEAENLHRALIACPEPESAAVMLNANYVTLRGFRVTGGAWGVYVLGADVGQDTAGSGNVIEDVEVFGSRAGVIIRRGCSNTRLTRLDSHDNAPYDGLKLDSSPPNTFIRDTVVEDSHLHHNHGNGVFEGNATRTIIRNCEIDHNGATPHGNGLYLKGFEGLIQSNRLHHNAGNGISLWAAPRGTATRHYIAEWNEAYENGDGIALGGTPGEAYPYPPLPPGDGMPHFVEVRFNTIHDNRIVGFNYLGDTCGSTANDNSFHHNTVYRNRNRQLQIVAARGSSLLVRSNIFLGPSFRESPILVFLMNTDLAPGAMDSNIYDMPGAGPATTPGPIWWRCNSVPPVDARYNFDQIRTGGIRQDNSCGADPSCGSSTVLMDERSRWTDPLVVDPGATWAGAVGPMRGDPGAAGGLPAASGGLSCDLARAGSILEDEAVPICAPGASDAPIAGLAVGAD